MKSAWNSWQEYLNVGKNDILEESAEKEDSKPDISVMRLDVNDVGLYGRYPEYDDFYLITCKVCGKRVKPQCLYMHTELRHSNLSTPTEVNIASLPSKQASVLLLPPPCSKESPINEVNNLNDLTVSRSKERIKYLSNKKPGFIQHTPLQCSQHTYVKKNAKLDNSSGLLQNCLTKNIKPEQYVSVRHSNVEKLHSKSSSNCDSQTSMTVFLHQSLIMPNVKHCDTKGGQNNCVQSLADTTSNKHNVAETAVLRKVLPMKKRHIESPEYSPEIHEVKNNDWYDLQNGTNMDLSNVSYSWNKGSCFRSLSHRVPISENAQINSFDMPDLSKFGEIETKVLIQSAAMST